MTNNNNDYELLYYLHKEVESAQETLYLKYRRFMWKVVHEICYDRGNYNFTLDDAYQEASWAFFDATNTYHEEHGVPFSAYLVKCIKNRVLLLIRKNQTKSALQLKYAIPYDSPRATNDHLVLSEIISSDRAQFDPVSYIRTTAALEHAQNIITSLSASDQLIFIYRNMGYPYSTIAKLTNTTPKYVDNVLSKIRRLFKEETHK